MASVTSGSYCFSWILLLASIQVDDQLTPIIAHDLLPDQLTISMDLVFSGGKLDRKQRRGAQS